MIKGCSRKVIVVKNPGSDLFEEAYFILNPREADRRQDDFLLEANRIIQSKNFSGYEKRKKQSGILQVLAGFVFGVFVSAAAVYFLF